MADLDQFQTTRASARIKAIQTKPKDEATTKEESENQIDSKDVPQTPKHTPTPQRPAQKRNRGATKRAATQASKRKPATSNKITLKRKAEADSHVEESSDAPKRRKCSALPSTPWKDSTQEAAASADVEAFATNSGQHAATLSKGKRKLGQGEDDIGETPHTTKWRRLSSGASTAPGSSTLEDAGSENIEPLNGTGDSMATEIPMANLVTGAVASLVTSEESDAAALQSSGNVVKSVAAHTGAAPFQIIPSNDTSTHDLQDEAASSNEQLLPPSNDEVTSPDASAEHRVEKGGANSSLLSTPMSATNQITQLLTPPASVPSSDSERRPKRTRKQPELYGNVVSTESAVDNVTGDFSSESSYQEERRSSIASTIEVTPRSPPSTPQSGRGWKKSSGAASKTKQPSSKKSRATSANDKEPVTPRVTKSRAKSTPRARKKAVTESAPAQEQAPTASNSRKNSTSASARLGVLEESQEAEGDKSSAAPRNPFVIRLPLPQPDPKRLALSQALTKREPLASKPQPQGKPEVWADSRQALCETLPYFKKPQGGCYQNDGHVYGFLFDTVGHCREYMDEDVIICRAGGSMESDPNGGMVQRKNQTLQEAQVQAVQNDIAHHNPVVVICGNRNEKAPCKMPHQYSVLGWYKPVSVWSEKTAGKGKKVWTTVKYRLERLNRHEPAWHAPQDIRKSADDNAIAEELTYDTCEHCRHEYPQIYLRSWVCLNQNCEHFWRMFGADAPCGSEGLEYNPAFLLHRSKPWASESEINEPEPSPLRPALPNFGNTVGDNLTYINTRGICCPDCGRCSSRRLFSGWVCENPTCDFRLSVAHQPLHPAILHTPWDAAPTLVRNRHLPSVQIAVEHKQGYKVSTYTFDGIDGRFIHAAATKTMVQEKGGADDMFKIMQSEDMGLERRTFAGKKMSDGRGGKSVEGGEESHGDLTVPESVEEDEELPSDKKPEFAKGDLMTAFSMNYGMPYKFVAAGASKSFDEAPEAVREARRRLNWAARAFLQTSEDEDFNEELIFAYLQGQKIEYHDDGEEGLGPRIATLSLGGRAKMHMRMKMKHHVGCSKTGLLTEERPVPGGVAYEQRLRMWEELQQLKSTDSAAYNRRRKEIPKELGIFDKRNKKAEDLVTISLSHGDIVLMDGYDIQKYLEHKVVPEDHLRFALTCRTVLAGHLKEEERPGYAVERDPSVYLGPEV